MRFWLLLNVFFLAVISPAEVHICKSGLIEAHLQAKFCIDENTAETERPLAAEAVGIYSATVPLILLLVFALLTLYRLSSENEACPSFAFAVPTPPPRFNPK